MIFRQTDAAASMANVLNQSALISAWHDDLQHCPRKISLCPNKILSFDSAPANKFPSLKVKSQLYGKKLAFRENFRLPGTAKSFSPSSSTAQVRHILLTILLNLTLLYSFMLNNRIGVIII